MSTTNMGLFLEQLQRYTEGERLAPAEERELLRQARIFKRRLERLHAAAPELVATVRLSEQVEEVLAAAGAPSSS